LSKSEEFHSSPEELEEFANIFRLSDERIKQAEITKFNAIKRAKYNRWSKGTIATLLKLKEKIDTQYT
tara:strand:+ start:31559 stop:31762 length:204 start_codon:yes stop_codon:yes gene_type:complete